MAAQYRITLAFLILLSVVPAIAADSISLPFKSDHCLLLVDVTIDGQPKVLVFDTGAERTFIRDKRNVERASLVVIGDRTLRDFRIAYVNLDGESLDMVHADGALGQDILRQFKTVRIDYKTHVIILE